MHICFHFFFSLSDSYGNVQRDIYNKKGNPSYKYYYGSPPGSKWNECTISTSLSPSLLTSLLSHPSFPIQPSLPFYSTSHSAYLSSHVAFLPSLLPLSFSTFLSLHSFLYFLPSLAFSFPCPYLSFSLASDNAVWGCSIWKWHFNSTSRFIQRITSRSLPGKRQCRERSITYTGVRNTC